MPDNTPSITFTQVGETTLNKCDIYDNHPAWLSAATPVMMPIKNINVFHSTFCNCTSIWIDSPRFFKLQQ